MTCAYTNLTNGLLGSIKTKSLKEAYKYKQEKETRHFLKYGKYHCLIRDKSFPKYISMLKKDLV